MSRFAVRFAVLGAALVGLGCGGSSGSGRTAVITGKVTIAGKDILPGGDVVFTSVTDKDKVLRAVINGDGTYKLPGIAYGEHKVAVENEHLKRLNAGPVASGTASLEGAPAQAKYVKIDPKYTKSETSGLSTNVKEATVTYNIDLP